MEINVNNILSKPKKKFINNKDNLIKDWSFLYLNKESLKSYNKYNDILKTLIDKDDEESLLFKSKFLECIYDEIKKYVIFIEFKKNMKNINDMKNIINYLSKEELYNDNDFLKSLKMFIDSEQDVEKLYKIILLNIDNSIVNIQNYANHMHDIYFSNNEIFDENIVELKKEEFINKLN